MRYVWAVVLALVMMMGVMQGSAVAMEGPLAGLVPAEVSSYTEVNLDRAMGKAPETAALGQVYRGMQSPAIIRGVFERISQGEANAEEVGRVFDMLKRAGESLGPRIGWATWMPDTGAMLGGMMGGMEGGGEDMAAALGMAPKVLVVADVRDGKAFDGLVDGLVKEFEIPARVTEGKDGTRRVTFAEGMVELIRGNGWVALGFPPERAEQAADRAGGGSADSLWSSAGYQGVIGRLPADAILTEYVSAQSVKQLLAAVNMLAPGASFSYPSEEPLGAAMGVRVEEVRGRKMATAYYTADLDTLTYLVDAPMALQAALMVPMFERARENARKATCLSNVKNLTLAMQMYAADNGDRFPEADGWVAALADYIMDESVLKCPDDESEAACSYGMNEAVSGMDMSELEDPAEVVVIFETAEPGENPVGGAEGVADPPRHLGGNNYGFADGHAEWSEEVPNFDVE